MIKKLFILINILLFSLPTHAAMGSQQLTHTEASLVHEFDSIQPGKPFRVAVWLRHEPLWHSYWENPGEAGIPTTLAWTLPEGFATGNIGWPAPEHMREGPLVVYSYHGDVLLPVTVTPPEGLKPGDIIPVKVQADWLVCKDICIPESAELEIALPVSEDAPTASIHAGLFAAHEQNAPRRLAEKGRYRYEGRHFVLSFPRDALPAGITSALFFPREPNVLVYSAEQKFVVEGASLSLTSDKTEDSHTGDITGLLMVETASGKQHFDITLSQSGEPAAAPPPTHAPAENGTADVGVALALLLAMAGGAILNLMPCVLPVLSLKALAVAKKAGHEAAQVRKLGVAYTLGILVSFAAIAGVLIALQQAGQAAGWGYQMQSPAFVGFLIYLLFLVGLNLSGMFELPVLFGNVGSELVNESSPRGSFFTGILATAVATPCTAPFMASAVGVALTLPAWQAMLVFQALGFGLALPFLLISFFPKLLRFLPKPGAWMDTFKQFLAFPMYASVIWLLWVLALQTGAGGMAVALCGMLALVMVIWMKRLYVHRQRLYHWLAVTLFAVVIALSLPMLSRMETGTVIHSGHEETGVETVPYSPEKLDALVGAGTPVFVDATAAWCITCQVNARVAIHTGRSMKAFKDSGTALMIADWTRQNPDISAYLKSFGYRGVPLYVYYPPHGKPVVLPQLLTESLVVSTITNQGE